MNFRSIPQYFFKIQKKENYNDLSVKAWGCNVRFFAVFLVIWMHLLSPISDTHPVTTSVFLTALNTMMSFFPVTALTFIAGYFCIANLTTFRLQQLLSVIVTTYVMFNLYVTLVYGRHDPNSIFLLEPAAMSWFLLCIIYWNCLILFFKNIKFNLIFAILIAIFIGCEPMAGSFLSVSRCFFFFPFFLAGYLMKEKGFFITLSKSSILIIILLLYVVTLMALKLNVPLLLLFGRDSYALLNISNGYGIFLRLCYYFLGFLAVFSLLSLVPKRETFFTNLGKNSMYAYLGHSIVLFILMEIGFYKHQINIFYELALILFAFVIDLILSSNASRYFWDLIFRPKFLIKLFLNTKVYDEGKNEEASS